MKRCSMCKVEKPLSEFYWRKQINNYNHSCKKCLYNYKKSKNYPQEKNKYYFVYMLPNANYYVGQTCQIKTRMSGHRCYQQRDTSDYIILHKCKTRKEALEYEKIYHKLGFPG